MVSKILLLAFVVGTASAATWFGRLPEKPSELAHKEGCYIAEVNDVVPFGTTVNPLGVCYSIHCSRGMVDYASCGTFSTDPDPQCYVTEEDVSKPYPECCPDFKCELDNKLF